MNLLSAIRRHILNPPYAWLPCAVFTYFVLSFALHPFSPFFTHHLADPDDYMRLDEVIAWLNGQSWHDLSVPRLSPGTHTVVHWSRLIDLPIAALALPFIPSLGVSQAVLAASFIVPLMWLALLLALLPVMAKYFVGKDNANLTCVMALFAPMLLFNYTPGRADHHGIQTLIAGFGLLALTRIIIGDKGKLCAILSALFFTCGFWIGAEALPWVILFTACLGFAAAWQGNNVARAAALFGLCLPLFTAAFIPLALPASEFSSRALSWFSPSYVIFAALSGAVLIGSWAVSLATQNRYLRIITVGIFGLCAAIFFFVLVPSALQGPFSDYDTFDATIALDSITEAQPLSRAFHFNRFMPVTLIHPALIFIRFLALPFIAIIVCFWNLWRGQNQIRLIWLAEGVFLSVALLLTVFWQLRVGVFMELFAIIPLTKLLCDWWGQLKWGLWDRPLFYSEIGAFLVLGALPVVLIPALAAHKPLYPDILLFPAARTAPACALENVTSFLNDASLFGTKALTILNTSDTGPQILFATHDNAISGNFDVAGNQDVFDFFRATDNAASLAVARKTNADLVLLCRNAPALYLGKDYYAPSHIALQQGKDGLLHFTNIDKYQPLITRLIKGEIPVWLKPIEIPTQSDYLLFRIQYPTGQK
jgi:hypothetical protein